MADIEKNLAAFKARQEDLEAHHKGKWVIFHDGELVNAFDTFEAAASEAVARFGRGPYLIRQVGAPDFVMPASVMYRLSPDHA